MRVIFKPWFWAGPYTFSGVVYGDPSWPSYNSWFIPGSDPDLRYPNP